MGITNETLRAKNAKLQMTMKAKSGFRSVMDCEVSSLQWAAINAICAETDEAKAFMDATAARLVQP